MAEIACGLAVGLGGLLLTLPPSHRHRRPTRTSRWRWLQVGGGSLGALVGWAATGWPAVAVLAASVGVLAPRSLAAHRAARRRAEVTEALAEAAAGLRDAVRAGHGLPDAIAEVARSGPPPLRDEFARLRSQAQLGGLPTALDGFADHLADPLADLLAAILRLNARLGGRQLTQSLDALAVAIRAEALTVSEVAARQAEQRLSARVVSAMPILALAAVALGNPALLAPYDSLAGQMVLLLAAGALTAAGYALTLRLGRPPEAIRLGAAAGGRR